MNTFTPRFLSATNAVPTVLWGLMVASSIAPATAQQTVYPMTTNSGSMNPNQTLKVTGLEVQQEGTFGKNVFVAKKIFLETFKDLPSQNPSKDYFAIIDGATGQLKRGVQKSPDREVVPTILLGAAEWQTDWAIHLLPARSGPSAATLSAPPPPALTHLPPTTILELKISHR